MTKIFAYSSHGVADTNDFLETIQDAINEESYHLNYDLKTIMDGWLYTEGYPILNVTRNYETQMVEIKQERFFLNTSLRSNQTWFVPINIATQTQPDFEDTRPDFWLKNSSINISIQADSEEWILLNKQVTGTTSEVKYWNFEIEITDF